MSPVRQLPTSADVARAAGVSRSTVSFVLNDTPGTRISEATRKRVLAAAADLGYVANTAAADLRRGASRTVLGVLDQARVDTTTTQFLPVITQALHRSGLTLVTTSVSGDVHEQQAHSWAALRPMAAVNFGAHLTTAARAVLAGTGCVIIGDRDADVAMTVDQGAMAAAAVAAMHERGRFRLLQVLPAERSLADLTRARDAAFATATGPRGLGTARLRLDPDHARALVATFLDWPVRPDGIVAQNDEYAAIVLGALLDAGIAVPAHIAVLGSENSPWGPWLRPALSTLATQPAGVVDRLVATLVSISQGTDYPTTLLLQPQVHAIHRQTT